MIQLGLSDIDILQHHDLDGFLILASQAVCESYIPKFSNQLAFMIPLRAADGSGTHGR